MKNKLLALFLSLVAVFSMIGFTACDKEQPDYGTLSVANITLEVGETEDILATFSKTEYADLAITYEENSDAISIANGQVTGLAAGTATVTAKTEYHTATFTVTVNPLPDYAFTIEDKTIEVGATAPVNAVFMDAANASEISYTFSKAGVVSISNGVISAIKAGKVTVTATTANYTETFVVTVPDRDFEIANVEMYIGETKAVTPVFADNTYAENVTYSVSGNGIAINGSTIIAYAAGSYTVTASTSYSSTTFTVEVEDRGTVSIDNMSVEFGVATPIVIEWTNPDAAETLTYTYDTSKLLIENGKVTGLVENVTVNVTATSENFSAMFTVEVGTNYGALVIADQDVIVGYYLNIPYEFTVAKYASEIEYEYDDTKIAIENDIITIVDGVTSGTVEVTAKTARHEVTFNVTIKAASALNDGRLTYFKQQVDKFDADEDSVLFIGDSFFDTRWFFTDFNTRFEGLNAYTYGTSSAQAFELLYWGQYIYDINPKAVVLNIGTNDIFDGNMDSKGAIENVLNVLYAYHVNMPETEIYWFTVIPRIGKSTTDIVALNNAVKAYAEKNNWLAVVDVYDIFANDTSLYKAGDTVHPACPAGYDAMMVELIKAGIRFEELPATAPTTSIEDWSVTKDQNLAATKVSIPNAYGEFLVEFDVTVTDYNGNAHISLSFNDQTGYRFLLWDANDKIDGNMCYGGQYGFTASGYGAYTNFNTSTNYYDITSKAKTVKIAVLVANEKAYLFADGVLQEVFFNAPAVNSFVIGTEATSANFANLVISKASFENSDLFNTYLNSAPAYDFAPAKATIGTDSAANGANNRIDAADPKYNGKTLTGAESSIYFNNDGESFLKGDFVIEVNVTANIPASGWYFVGFGVASPLDLDGDGAPDIDKCWGSTSPAIFTCPNGLIHSFANWGNIKGEARKDTVRNYKDINVIAIRQGDKLVIAIGVKADGENYAYTYVEGTYVSEYLMMRIRQNACATTVNNVSFATDEVSIGNAIEVVTGTAYAYADIQVNGLGLDGAYTDLDGATVTLTQVVTEGDAATYTAVVENGKIIIPNFVVGTYNIAIDGYDALTGIALVEGANSITLNATMFGTNKDWIVTEGTLRGYKLTSTTDSAKLTFANVPANGDVFSFDYTLGDWSGNRLCYAYPTLYIRGTVGEENATVWVQIMEYDGNIAIKTATIGNSGQTISLGTASALANEPIHFDIAVVNNNLAIYVNGQFVAYAAETGLDTITSGDVQFFREYDKNNNTWKASDIWYLDNFIITKLADREVVIDAQASFGNGTLDTRIAFNDIDYVYGDYVEITFVVPTGYTFATSVVATLVPGAEEPMILNANVAYANGKVVISFYADNIYSGEYMVAVLLLEAGDFDTSITTPQVVETSIPVAVIFGNEFTGMDYAKDGSIVTVYDIYGNYVGEFEVEDGYITINTALIVRVDSEGEIQAMPFYALLNGEEGMIAVNSSFDPSVGKNVFYGQTFIYDNVKYNFVDLDKDYDNFDYTVTEQGVYIESIGGKGGIFYFDDTARTDSIKLYDYTVYYQGGTQCYGGIIIGGVYFNSGVWGDTNIAIKPLNKEVPSGNIRVSQTVDIDGVKYAYVRCQALVEGNNITYYYYNTNGQRVFVGNYTMSNPDKLTSVQHDDFKGKIKYNVAIYEGQDALDLLSYTAEVGDTSLSDLELNKTELGIGDKLVGTITPYPSKAGMYVVVGVRANFYNTVYYGNGSYDELLYSDYIDFVINPETGVATFEFSVSDLLTFTKVVFDVQVTKVDDPTQVTANVIVNKDGKEVALADGKTATLKNLNAAVQGITLVYNAVAVDGALVFENVIPGEYLLTVEGTYGTSTLIVEPDADNKYEINIKLDYAVFVLDNFNNVALKTQSLTGDAITLERADATNNKTIRLAFNPEIGDVVYLRFTVTDAVFANYTERALTQMSTDGIKGASYGTRWTPSGHGENIGDKSKHEFQYRSNNTWWKALIKEVNETGNVLTTNTITLALAIDNGTATFYKVNDNNEHVVVIRDNGEEWIHSDAYSKITGISIAGYAVNLTDVAYATSLDNLVVIETEQTEDKKVENGGYVDIDYTGKLYGDVAITVVPEDGYVFETLTVNGKDYTADVKNGVCTISKFNYINGEVVATFAPADGYVNVVIDANMSMPGIEGSVDFVPGEWFTLTGANGIGYTYEVSEDGTLNVLLAVGEYTISSKYFYPVTIAITELEDDAEYLDVAFTAVKKLTLNAPDANFTNFGYDENGYYYTTNTTTEANGIEFVSAFGAMEGKAISFTYDVFNELTSSDPEKGVNNVFVFKGYGNNGVATELQLCVWDSHMYIKACHNGVLNNKSKGNNFHQEFILVVTENSDFALYLADGTYLGSAATACPNKDIAGNGINRLVAYLDATNTAKTNFKMSNIKVIDLADINLSIAETEDAQVALDVETLSFNSTATLTATPVEGKVITQVLANGKAINFNVDADGVATAEYKFFGIDMSDVEFEVKTADVQVLNTLITVKSKFAWNTDATLANVPAGTVLRLVAENGDTYVITLGEESEALTYAPHVAYVAYADGYVPTVVTLEGGKQTIVLNKAIVDSINGDYKQIVYTENGASLYKERGRSLDDYNTYLTKNIDTTNGVIYSYTQRVEVYSYNYGYLAISNKAYFATGSWNGASLSSKPWNDTSKMFTDVGAIITIDGVQYREIKFEYVILPTTDGKYMVNVYADKTVDGKLEYIDSMETTLFATPFLATHPWHGKMAFIDFKVIEGADVAKYLEDNKATVTVAENDLVEVEVSNDVIGQLETSTITLNPVDVENAYYEVTEVFVNGKKVNFTVDGAAYNAKYVVEVAHKEMVSSYDVTYTVALREDAILTLGTANQEGVNVVDLDKDGVITFGSDTVTVSLGAKVAVVKAYANGQEVAFVNNQADHTATITINHTDNAVDEYVLTYELADYRTVSGKVTQNTVNLRETNIPVGKTITLSDGTNTYSAVVAEDGSYKFEDVLVGSYTLSLGANYTNTATVTVVLGQDLVFDYCFNYKVFTSVSCAGDSYDDSLQSNGTISAKAENKTVRFFFNQDMGQIKYITFKIYEPDLNDTYIGADAASVVLYTTGNFYNTDGNKYDTTVGHLGVQSYQGYWQTRNQGYPKVWNEEKKEWSSNWSGHGKFDGKQMAKFSNPDEGLRISAFIYEGKILWCVENGDGIVKLVAQNGGATQGNLYAYYFESIHISLDTKITDIQVSNQFPAKLIEDVKNFNEDGGSVTIENNTGWASTPTITATPNDGYVVDYLLVNGAKVDANADGIATITTGQLFQGNIVVKANFVKADEAVANTVKVQVNAKFNYESDSKFIPYANTKFAVTTPTGAVVKVTSDADGYITLTNAINGDYVLALDTAYDNRNGGKAGMYQNAFTIVDGVALDAIYADRLVINASGFNGSIVKGRLDVGYVANYDKANGTANYFDFDRSFMLEQGGFLKINYKVAERPDCNVASNGNTRSFTNLYLEGVDTAGNASSTYIQICNWNSRICIKNSKTNGANGEQWAISGVGGIDLTFYVGIRDNAIVVYDEDGVYKFACTSSDSANHSIKLASVNNVRWYRYVENNHGIAETYTISGVDAQTINFVDKAEGATLAFDKSAIAFGEQATITATPNDGLVVTGIYVDGVKLDAVANGNNVVANFRNNGSSKLTANVTVTTAQKAVKTLTADVKTMFPWDKYADVAKDGTVVNFVGDNGIFSATVAGGKISVDINDGTYSVDFGATSTPVTVTVANGAVANDSITLIKKFINTDNPEAMLRTLVENENGMYLKKFAQYRNYNEINSNNDNIDWTGKVVLTGEALIEAGTICFTGVGLAEKYAINFGVWNGQMIITKPFNNNQINHTDYTETIDGKKHYGIKFVQILDTDADMLTVKIYSMGGALLQTIEKAESRTGFRMGCDDPQGQFILRNTKMLDGQDAVDFLATL